MIPVLRGMYVHIVHGRNKQFVAEVRYRQILKGIGQLLIYTDHLAAVNSNISVLDYLKLRTLFREENVCFIDFHDMFFDYFLCVSSERMRLRAKVYKYKIAAKIQKKNDICKPESKKVTENAKRCQKIW